MIKLQVFSLNILEHAVHGLRSILKLITIPGGNDGASCLNTMERYDPVTDTWTCLAPMSTRRSTHDVAVIDGMLFAVGGNDGSSSLNSTEKYDPETNKWTPVVSMSTRRSSVGVVVAHVLLLWTSLVWALHLPWLWLLHVNFNIIYFIIWPRVDPTFIMNKTCLPIWLYLYVNPLTPTVKPWVTKFSSFWFYCMDGTQKCDHSLESYWAVLYLFFNFTQFVVLENLSVLDLALSKVKGLKSFIVII